jgi:hypothetical protein
MQGGEEEGRWRTWGTGEERRPVVISPLRRVSAVTSFMSTFSCFVVPKKSCVAANQIRSGRT